MSTLNKFNLDKEVEKTKFVLTKKNIPTIKAQVAANIDVSGSMQDLFQSGTVQAAFQRILPIGLTFDDNGEVDVFTFAADNDSVTHIPKNATANNYQNYVQEQILDNDVVPKWGGTSYSHVIEENLKAFGFYEEVKKGGFLGFGGTIYRNLKEQSESGYPVIVYHFTDGENQDPVETRRLLERLQSTGSRIYYLFVGIGNCNFRFLEDIARDYSNTGFLNIKDLESFSNDEDAIMQLLPDELCEWLKE